MNWVLTHTSPLLIMLTLFSGVSFQGCLPDNKITFQTFSSEIETALARNIHPDLHTPNDDLIAMGRVNPEFGGMFKDAQGNFNVYLRGSSLIESRNVPDVAKRKFRAALAKVYGEDLSKRISYLPNGNPLNANPNLQFIEGRFSIIELARWYPDVQEAFQIEGVMYTDLDEALNRITIGISEESLRSSVSDLLDKKGVPLEMVFIKISPPIAHYGTLRDRFRPTLNGIFIINEFQQPCTLGMNVIYGDNSDRGFITPTHCTRSVGVNHYAFHQLSVPTEQIQQSLELYPPQLDDSNYIGVEVLDPPFKEEPWPYLRCPNLKPCYYRYSDAALISYDLQTSMILGGIAKPISRNTGSLIIDDADNIIPIRGEVQKQAPGEYVNKIGSVTGWTTGKLSKTCAEEKWSNQAVGYYLKCQNTVERITDPQDPWLFGQEDYRLSNYGDSGAIVFYYYKTGDAQWAELNGMLWGGEASTDPSFYRYSAVQQIRKDLGSFQTYYP